MVTGTKFKPPEIPSLVPDFTEERQDICVNIDQQRLTQSFRRFCLCGYFDSQPKESNFLGIALVLMQGYYYTKMVFAEPRNGKNWLYLLLFLRIIVVPGTYLSDLLGANIRQHQLLAKNRVQSTMYGPAESRSPQKQSKF